MRILVVTDAWHPQVNGVVRTLGTLSDELTQMGHEPVFITPDQFRSVPCPTYPEIRLALRPGPRLARTIEANQPCAIHIATEGPLGWAARRYCLKRRLPFTTAYHTKFPEYIRARFRVPLPISYRLVRKFHAPASTIMVATQTIQDELEHRGFERIRRWSRGVDTELFRRRSICRAPNWWSATARSSTICAANIPMWCSPAPRWAKSWPRITPPPRSSSSRAGPTHSAWCCSKPWPPACLWPPIPCRALWT